MPKCFIVMGDVMRSSRFDARQLRTEFRALLRRCNRRFEDRILSAFTNTLGDEFQGVAESLYAAAQCVFYLESVRFEKGHGFKLRYVVHYGEIQTPIKKGIAYEMMGPGLSKARDLLTNRRRGRPRFLYDLPDERLSENLTRICEVTGGLSDRWRKQDYPLICDMLANQKNDEVAEKHGKNRSQIWKRRKHLLIEEYRLSRSGALYLAAGEGKTSPR